MPPPASDPSFDQYNSMQQQAGLLPGAVSMPPVVFPGQISAMIAAGGPGAAMGALSSAFPGSTYQTMTGAPPMFQGPTGIFQPQMPAMPYNPYASANPYASLGPMGPPSLFSPSFPAPPPVYAGPQGSQMVPFGPMAPQPHFNTPYGMQVAQAQAEDDRMFAMHASAGGMAARVGADALGGLAGAALGRRFGMAGAVVGGLAGFAAAEYGGVGQFAQNTFMDYGMSPAIQRRGLASGIEHASQHFVPFGAHLHQSGAGFSHHASLEAAGGIMALGNSASFQRETFERFNTQDLARITQSAAHSGMMSGVSNPEEMVGRVREIAKSVNAFMELAKEPDLQRAIHTMGSLRGSGLNLTETLGAVQNGRTFARMAGTSFQEMAELGGSAGSATYQSMGLSQGQGFRTGMANFGIASASQHAGILSPHMMSLVGGAQGLGNLNNMFSAGTLQLPMLAPGMMTANGGLDAGALRGLLSGRADLFSMTGRGANVLSGMAGRHGVEGLGMTLAMQPFLQDRLNQIMQSQGPFAQRNTEDTLVAGLSRQMGQRGSAGFMTAGLAMGMSPSQALARAQEMASPGYFAGQRQQLDVGFREARAAADRRAEADRPTIGGTLHRTTALGDIADAFREGAHHFGTTWSREFGGEESRMGFYVPETDLGRRRMSRTARSRDYLDYARRTTRGANLEEMEQTFFSRLGQSRTIADAMGGRGLGSALSAPLISAQLSDADRRQMAHSYAQSASFSRILLGENAGDERRAARNMGATFGQGQAGINALLDFSRDISNMRPTSGIGTQGAAGMLVNGLVRGGAGALMMGAIDPGNIVGPAARSGEQYRDAFVNAMMRHQGMGRDQATSIFERHGEQIVMQSSPLARLTMTAEDREGLRAALNIGNRLGGRGGGTVQRARRDEKEGYDRILGHGASHGERTTYNSLMDNVEGLGREGTARYDRSRYIISAMAMSGSVARHAGPENQRAGNDAIQRIYRQAAAEGFSTEELQMMANRANGMGSRFQEGEGALTALAFVRNAGSERTGRGILDRFQRGDRERQDAQVLQRSAAGFADLGRGSGVLGRAFKNVTAEGFSQEDAETRLHGLGRDDLRQLSQEGAFGRQMSDLIRRFQGGDQTALSRINEMMSRAGEAREAGVRNEYRRRHGYFGNRIKDFFFRNEQDRSADEQRWVDSQLQANDPTSQRLRNQAYESIATESTMQDQGIGATANAQGRGEDALVTASTELRRVAELFRDTIQGGGLDNLVGGGPGGM